MTATEALAAFLAAGARPWVDERGKLMCRAPRGGLSHGLLALGVRHRSALLKLLRGVATCEHCRAGAEALLPRTGDPLDADQSGAAEGSDHVAPRGRGSVLVWMQSPVDVDSAGKWALCASCYRGDGPPPSLRPDDAELRRSRA